MRRSSDSDATMANTDGHLARAVALRDRDGTILRWIGTNTDVDDQKNVEGLLEAAAGAADRRAGPHLAGQSGHGWAWPIAAAFWLSP